MTDRFRELTHRDDDRLPSYPNVAWRGFAYLDRIEPVLPEAEGFGDDVDSGQRCWVSYLPATDEFLVGYDLWLRGGDGDEGEAQMAAGFIKLRLSVEGAELKVSIVGHERFPGTVYGKGLDAIEARHPDRVEIDID